MIKSMTGFASVTGDDERATIGVTIRSVNHRYLDVQLRSPQSMNALETRLRALVQQYVARGRVEVAVSVQLRQQPKLEVELNEAFAAALAQAMDHARAVGLVQGSLQPGDILRFPQALTVREQPAELDPESASAVEAAVLQSVQRALEDLDVMRRREGVLLQADLDGRKVAVAGLMERIAALAHAGDEQLRARLGQRVAELTADLALDRAAITQEVVRFASHRTSARRWSDFEHTCRSGRRCRIPREPCGRKLDFLLQEMNREVNTTGSKADGPGVPEAVINVKAELEKMREQVQNVE